MAKSMVGKVQSLSTIYEWEIQDYSLYRGMAVGENIISPLFRFRSGVWQIEMYPNGIDEECKNYISLYLCLKNKNTVTAQFRFFILDSKRNIIARSSDDSAVVFNGVQDWGEPSLINSFSIPTSASRNIKVICEIIPEGSMVDNTLLVSSSTKVQHFKGFKGYINNTQFSDIKLMVEQKEIFAHKMVLAANSEVFAAMFTHEMQENKDSTVVIEDIKYEVFCELLRFMYTGESSLTKDIASELLKASEKYGLLKLKDMCEEDMCKNLSTYNAIEWLHLADMYSAQRLKTEAIAFFASHGQEMIDQPEFDSLRSLHPELFRDVLRSVFERSEEPIIVVDT